MGKRESAPLVHVAKLTVERGGGAMFVLPGSKATPQTNGLVECPIAWRTASAGSAAHKVCPPPAASRVISSSRSRRSSSGIGLGHRRPAAELEAAGVATARTGEGPAIALPLSDALAEGRTSATPAAAPVFCSLRAHPIKNPSPKHEPRPTMERKLVSETTLLQRMLRLASTWGARVSASPFRIRAARFTGFTRARGRARCIRVSSETVYGALVCLQRTEPTTTVEVPCLG
jgi:hypothetical protein